MKERYSVSRVRAVVSTAVAGFAVALGCATDSFDAANGSDAYRTPAPPVTPILTEESEKTLHNVFNISCDPPYFMPHEGEVPAEYRGARSEADSQTREEALLSCAESVRRRYFPSLEVTRRYTSQSDAEIAGMVKAAQEGYFIDLIQTRLEKERQHTGKAEGAGYSVSPPAPDLN